MKGRVFNIVAGVSLVVCMATIAFSVRGNWQCDQVNGISENYEVSFASANSVMMMTFGPNYKGPDALPAFDNGWRFSHYSAHEADQEVVRCQIPNAQYHQLGWLGFAYDPNRLQSYPGPPKQVWYSSYRFYFPHWSLVAITGILPSMLYWRRRRERIRTKLGHCVNCGYDLRATPERCPECGTVPAIR